MARIAFSANKGSGFKLPPEGTYDFEITDVKTEEKPDKNGDPRIYLQLKIADGPQAGSEVRHYHTLSSERGWTLREVLQAAGVDYAEEDGGEGEPYSIECDTDELIGRYFRADLTHWKNTNTGKVSANINQVQVSPLQEAAAGGDADAAEEPAPEPAKTAPKAATTAAKAAPQGTARPRPRQTTA
jgi:hypothetical protein